MVRYPGLAARHIFISGSGTITKDRPDKFGIRPILGRWSISTSEVNWGVSLMIWSDCVQDSVCNSQLEQK